MFPTQMMKMGRFELGHHSDTIKTKMFVDLPVFSNLPMTTANFSTEPICVRFNSDNHRSA